MASSRLHHASVTSFFAVSSAHWTIPCALLLAAHIIARLSSSAFALTDAARSFASAIFSSAFHLASSSNACALLSAASLICKALSSASFFSFSISFVACSRFSLIFLCIPSLASSNLLFSHHNILHQKKTLTTGFIGLGTLPHTTFPTIVFCQAGKESIYGFIAIHQTIQTNACLLLFMNLVNKLSLSCI